MREALVFSISHELRWCAFKFSLAVFSGIGWGRHDEINLFWGLRGIEWVELAGKSSNILPGQCVGEIVSF